MKALLGLLPTRGQVSSVRSLFADWTVLGWAALPVTDRRWTAPLAATAVGMGLFIGVAMGPGIGETVGAAQQIIQMPATGDAAGGGDGTATADAGPPPLQGPVGNTPAAPPPSSAAIPSTTPSLGPTAPVAAPPPAPASEPTATTEETDETEETPPPEEPEQELVFKGTVMHVNDAAASYVLTTAKGQMNAIHSKQLPEPATKLAVPVRELANGTYAEDGKVKRGGSASKVRFQGLVTYSDPATGAYTVSRRGASVLVHQDPAVQPPPAPPEVAAQVTVSATIGAPPPAEVEPPPTPPTTTPPTTPPPTTPPATTPPPTSPSPTAAVAGDCGTPPEPPEPAATIVTESSHKIEIEFLGYSDFEGIVQGVCADSGELILSADDLRESGADLTLSLDPEAGIDLLAIEPGDIVDAGAVIEEQTWELSLTGISDDRGIKGADDADLAQGDQAG